MSVLEQKQMLKETSEGFHQLLQNEQAIKVTQIAEDVSNNYEIKERITPK